MPEHPKTILARQVREGLPRRVAAAHETIPQEHLLPTSHLVAVAVEAFGVTAGMVRRHLTLAVGDGTLVEILVRRDWLVVLPDAADLPPLYARDTGLGFELTREAPNSRGSDGISFLTTPASYKHFLRVQRRKHKTKALSPHPECQVCQSRG